MVDLKKHQKNIFEVVVIVFIFVGAIALLTNIIVIFVVGETNNNPSMIVNLTTSRVTVTN